MRGQIRFRFCIHFCWFLIGLAGSVQYSSAATATPTATIPEPTPIPLSDIAVQAESATLSLRRIQTTLSSDQVTTDGAKRIPELKDELELRTEEMEKLLGASLPLEFLYRMDVVVQAFGGELSRWNHDLAANAKTLEGHIAELERLSKIWKATLGVPELSQAAPEIPKRVQSLIGSIADTQHAVIALREKDLAMLGEVLESIARLQAASSALDQAENTAVKKLFTQDSPPIWSIDAMQWTKQSRASLIWHAGASVCAAFIKRRPEVFLVHAFLLLLLLFVVYWLRRGLHKWTKTDPELRRAAPFFDVPVSTAITLSFLIATPLYSLAPFVLRAILGGAILIPTALILRRLIDRRLFPIVNALLVFYFADQLRTMMVVLPTSGRFLYSAEMLGGTLFTIWLIRRENSLTDGANTTKTFGRVIRIAARIGLIIFPVTFLANVFGYVNLSNLLGSGTLRSAYFGAALYATLRVVEGLIIISMEVGPLSLLRVVRFNRPILQRRICGVAAFLAFLYWLSLTLNFFAVRTLLIESAAAALEAPISIGSLTISAGQILAFAVAVWASFLVSKFLRFFLEGDVYSHWKLERGIPQAISAMVHYVVLLVGFFVALAALGVDLTKVTILAGAFTVGVGFGLQTVINNFVCGLILLFERPIKIGDVIQVDADIGEVRRIGIRASVIRTVDGSDVIVPNGTIISNKVTNWTFSDRYRVIEVPVSVARGVAPHRVIEVLKSLAASYPGLAKEPAPQAYVINFAPGSLSFQLRAWTDRYEDWVQVRSDLSIAVDEALARENITVA